MGNRNFVNGVADGFATSTRNVSNINAVNTAAIVADTKANFGAATEPNPGLVKVREAKGFTGKAKAMSENLKDGMREQAELDRQYREHVQSHEAYRELLEAQRIDRQAVINGTKYGRGKLNRPVNVVQPVFDGEVQVVLPLTIPEPVIVDY